jgi:hypothetical protein
MIFVINVHSCVDLITNSSSELFVCNSKQEEDSIVKILKSLVKEEDKKRNTHYLSCLFTQILKKPSKSLYSWDYLCDVPAEIKMHYEQYAECAQHYNFRDSGSLKFRQRRNELYQKDTKLQKSFCIDDDDICLIEKEKRSKKYEEASNQLWNNFNIDVIISEAEVYKCFLKVNNFPKEEIERVDEMVKCLIAKPLPKYVHLSYQKLSDPMQQDVLDKFDFFMAYGIRVKKGDWIIYSHSDNSVPENLSTLITSNLRAQRYHLG